MYKSFTTLMALGMAAAAPSRSIMSSRQCDPASTSGKLLIGTPGQILTADFSGTSFTVTSTLSQPGTAPSWLLYKDPSAVYAVNENAADLNLFTLDGAGGNPTLANTVQGTTGVVSLAFNANQTQLVGASYGTGSFDVWDVDAADGKLTLHTNVALTGPTGPKPAQDQHRAHQALLDPSGRYFVIPDLGGDSLAVVDSSSDYAVVSTVDVGTGSGPRHGGFVSVNGGSQASHYVVATELSSELVLFELTYGDDALAFKQTQRLSTYGAAYPPATPSTAAAGELAVSSGGHVYVSNRLSGNATDSIAHFVLEADASQGGASQLRFADTVSSGGLLPRMFSLSTDADQGHVFVANQGGELGVAAFRRDAATGALDPAPVASLPLADLVAPELAGQANMGPQFIQQI
ncbi:hypothetical protein SLS62_008499 [Diatrype stigma]|uniref:6-phosphogluconolactonase n=1 Tax=Diatrype stigma TaxID=117547 RepID=A0AAN9YNZ3_9PEZI